MTEAEILQGIAGQLQQLFELLSYTAGILAALIVAVTWKG